MGNNIICRSMSCQMVAIHGIDMGLLMSEVKLIMNETKEERIKLLEEILASRLGYFTKEQINGLLVKACSCGLLNKNEEGYSLGNNYKMFFEVE